MQFSAGEKLIIVMLSEIYDHLKVNGETDTKFIRSAIYNGNLWGLEWDMPGIFGVEETPESVVREVANVLDMWSFLERAYEKLSTNQKEQLATDVPWASDVKFRGFDGNNETSHMGVARFFIDDMDRWQEFNGRDFNSHMPSLDGYRRMLAVFEPMRTTLGQAPMNADQLTEVLKA